MYDSSIFTNVNKYVTNNSGKTTYTGILLASKINQKNGQDYPLLDVVDLDWNGAWIYSMNTYLHTTADLIDVLNELNNANEVGAITEEIRKIWDQINQITATYITYSYLEEHLSSYWQRKLIAGEYINIDANTNEVSVSGLPTYTYLQEEYASLFALENLRYYLTTNFYDKHDTELVAYEKAYEAIQSVIDGADTAFDTLKEVADWILQQNLWVIVDLEEILEVLKEYEETGEWPQDKYFTYNEETGEYTPANDPEDIDISGETTYWKQENYLIELKRLIKRVNRLDEAVGEKIYNENLGTYTYSGFYKDIEDLKFVDNILFSELNQVKDDVEEVRLLALDSYTMAYDSYLMGYDAYVIAYDAYLQSSLSIDKANQAYDMAYDAIIKVGVPTITGGYYEITEDVSVEELLEQGKELYYFDEDGLVVKAEEPYDFDNIKYYYYVEPQEGTGLTKRVEVVEDKADEALDMAHDALLSAEQSLFYLAVNNEDSTYVKLGLHPTDYEGDRNRVLSIITNEASINRKTGEIYGNGLVNMGTAFDIYTYASSWMMLYVDEDINFPEDNEETQE